MSPLGLTLDGLQGLPPALVIVDENDVLREKEKRMTPSAVKPASNHLGASQRHHS